MKKNSKNTRPKKYPITTVMQGRVPIFWPTKKLPRSTTVCNLLIENDWGRAAIQNCKLTQVHRNLLDLMFAHHHGIWFYGDGAVGLLVDLYEIQTFLQIEETNYTWLRKKLEDLRKTTFITETKDWIVYGGIVRKHSYGNADADHTANKFGKNKFYYVVFEAEFMKFFKVDTNIHYNSTIVDKIVRLKYAPTQALVRFCLTHRQVNAKLASVLAKIGVFRPESHDDQKSRIRKQIFEESETLINDFGIDIRPMKDSKELGIFYNQHKDVWFENLQ